MAQFETVWPALNKGRRVRREEWESVIRMFVSMDMLMCQNGNSKPWHHALCWDEITATDWQLVPVPHRRIS
jgi:hypothetical protein